MVKSRRFWSSSSVPSSTTGLRELRVVRFAPGADEFDFPVAAAEHGGAEIAEYLHFGFMRQFFSYFLRQGYAAANAYDVYVFGVFAPKYFIAHVSSYHVGRHAEFARGGGYYAENVVF